VNIDQVERLEAFINRRSPTPVRVASLEVVTGGYSRLTSRAWLEDANRRWAVIVRSDPPPGTAIIDTDRELEWQMVSAVAASGTVRMPAPLWCDPSGDELGSPTIITEMIDGPSLLAIAARRGSEHFSPMSIGLCELLADVHRLDTAHLPAHVEQPVDWDSYMESRIQGWADAERRLPMRDPFMRYIASWLRANKPLPTPLTLVHGDFQPNNVVVDPAGAYHLVDWELAHIGDPREDLGWLALLGINQPPDLIAGDREGFYERYRKLTGLGEDVVNQRTVDYFTALGAAGVFIPVIDRLGEMALTGTGSITVGYMSISVPSMHKVFSQAINRHDTALGGAS
jgi:aminoglycoside phosphotransferase (APT) family kinase protein